MSSRSNTGMIEATSSRTRSPSPAQPRTLRGAVPPVHLPSPQVSSPLPSPSDSSPSHSQQQHYLRSHLPPSVMRSLDEATSDSDARLRAHSERRTREQQQQQLHGAPTHPNGIHSSSSQHSQHYTTTHTHAHIRISKPSVRRTTTPLSPPSSSSSSNHAPFHSSAAYASPGAPMKTTAEQTITGSPVMDQILQASPSRSPTRTTQHLPPPIAPVSVSRSTVDSSGLGVAAADKLQRLLAMYAPTGGATNIKSAINASVAPVYSPLPPTHPSSSPPPLSVSNSHFTANDVAKAMIPYLSATTSTAGSSSPYSSTLSSVEPYPSPSVHPSGSASSASLQQAHQQIQALQAALTRSQQDLAEHIDANKFLVQEFQKLEYENIHLHESLANRNDALMKHSEKHSALLDSMDSSKTETNIKEYYKTKFESLLAESQKELVKQLQEVERIKNAKYDTLRRKYEHVSEGFATVHSNYTELRDFMWNSTQANRKNAIRALIPVAVGAEGAEWDVEVEDGPGVMRIAALTKAQLPLNPLLIRSHIFQSWRHARCIKARNGLPSFESKQRLLDRVVKRLASLAKWNAFRQWKSAIDAWNLSLVTRSLNDQKAKRLALLVQQWRNKGIWGCFEAWKNYTKTTRSAKKKTLEKALLRFTNHKLYAAFRIWNQFVEKCKFADLRVQLDQNKKQRIQLLIHRWRMNGIMPYFHGWKDFARTTRARKKEVLGKICKRLMQLELYRGFRSWKNFVQQGLIAQLQSQLDQTKKARVKALISRWRLKGLTPFFLGWKTHVRETRGRKKMLMGKVVRRIEKLQEHKALRQWRLFVESDKLQALRNNMQEAMNVEKQKRVKALISRWRLSSLGPVFQSWATFTRENRGRKKALLDSILRKLSQSSLWQSWRRWTSFVENTKLAHLNQQLKQVRDGANQSKRARAMTVINAWRMRSATAAFKEWRHYARTIREKKRTLLGSVVKRMGSIVLYQGWRLWKLYTEGSRKHEFLARIQGEKQKRVVALIQRWRLASCTPIFHAWRQFSRTNRLHKRTVLDKIIRRLEKLPLHRGFRQWRHQIDASKLAIMQRELAGHKKARAHAAIAAWRTRTVLPTFVAWKEFARKNRERKHQLLKGIIHKLAYNSLYRAWGQWKHYNDSIQNAQFRAQMEAQYSHLSNQLMEQKKRRYQAMLKRWQPRSKKEIFVAWRTTIKEQRQRKFALLGKVLDRLSNIQLYQAYRHWCLFVERSRIAGVQSQLQGQLNALKAKQVKALLERWRARTAVPVFHAWRTYTRATRDRKRTLLDKSLKRMANLSLFHAWKKWSAFVAQSDVADLKARLEASNAALSEELQQQKQKRVKAMIARWRLSSLGPIFLSWKTWTRETRDRKKQLLHKILQRISQQELWRSFRHWIQFTEADRVNELQRKFQAQQQGLTDEYSLALQKQKQARVKQMIENWRRRSVAPTFLAWRSYSKTTRARKKELLGKVCKRLMNREVYLAMRQWKEWLENSRLDEMRERLNGEKAKRVKALVEKWSRSTLIPSFHSWRTYVQQQRLLRAEHEKQKQIAMEQVIRRLAYSSKHQALRQWKHFVDQARLADMQAQMAAIKEGKRQMVTAMLQRWATNSLKDNFITWHRNARTLREQKQSLLEKRQGKMHQVLSRLAQHQLWRSFRTWLLFADKAKSDAWNNVRTQFEMDADFLRQENMALKKKLEEQIEITSYLYKVVQNSV